jgi:YD repeat-containing protein
LKTTFVDGSFTTSVYDNQGRQISTTDQMGLTTNYQYDIYGRLTGVVLPPVPDPRNNNAIVNPTTTYSYDIYGDMTQIKDAIANAPAQSGDTNRVTSFTFDQYGCSRPPSFSPPIQGLKSILKRRNGVVGNAVRRDV